jgi:hypothetical protein
MNNSQPPNTPNGNGKEPERLANGDRVLVVSEPGAALYVERIELSPETQRSLTANVSSIPPYSEEAVS